jgi:hypothetical protein
MLGSMPQEAPQVAEAQTVQALDVDRSADQGSGGLIVCADIHDGQILNHRGTMDTECSEQALFSDLCVHRDSVVNLLGLTFMTVRF